MWRVALYSEPVLDARTARSASLTPGEVLRLERRLDPVDRHRFVVSHDLLRRAVADSVGGHPADVVLDFTCERCGEQHGAPKVFGRAHAVDVAVSLSRSGGAALVGVLVAPAGERAPSIGVDLERVDDVGFDGFDDVALGPAEVAWLDRGRAASAGAGGAARAALWVRKEAVAKAHGAGLRRDPREIGVAGSDRGVIRLDGRSFAWLDVEASQPGFAAALAVEGVPADQVVAEPRTAPDAQ